MITLRTSFKSLLLISGIVMVGSLLTALPGQTQDTRNVEKQTKSKEDDIERIQLPVAIYSASSLPTNPTERDIRIARNSRFDDAGSPPIAGLNPKLEVIRLDSNWETDLSGIPVDKSDAVILGKVRKADAYLSNDKSGVYSEFIIRVQKVIKAPKHLALTQEELIAVTREGGAVQLPDGRLIKYIISNQNMPRVGRQYVFFLKYNGQGQDYPIITAYEIHKEHIIPLDNVNKFSVYEGTDEQTFLDAVAKALIQSGKDQ